jgi:predicted HicB family RNase H-like nuclease
MVEAEKMSEPKPQASLSSNLLARKGGAKPAMRRQGLSSFPDNSSDSDVHEDLGWNDMGYDVDPDHEAHPIEHLHHNPLAGAIPNPGSVVRHQQEEIAAKLGARPVEIAETPKAQEEPVAAPVPLSISREVQPLAEHSAVLEAARSHKREAKKPRAAVKSRTRKAKTAFTLRMDPERHLKLRLATAVKNISAQQLVTKAVDEYLRSIPELEGLAERIPSRGAA